MKEAEEARLRNLDAIDNEDDGTGEVAGLPPALTAKFVVVKRFARAFFSSRRR